MRVFAVVLHSEQEQDEKFEILDTDFIPMENTLIILKHGDRLEKASVVKVENVIEKVGENADVTLNVFIKILPPEQNVN